MKNQLLLQAADFAAQKHRDQKRKDAVASPYINHPITVARLLADVGGVEDEEILAAALLHDTVEDTETTLEELQACFGARVRGFVAEVTDDKTLCKEERKSRQVEHAQDLSAAAALIKLGDKISNVVDVIHNPPAGWKLSRRIEYLDWSEQVMGNLPPVNAPLEARFREVLAHGRKQLEEG